MGHGESGRGNKVYIIASTCFKHCSFTAGAAAPVHVGEVSGDPCVSVMTPLLLMVVITVLGKD